MCQNYPNKNIKKHQETWHIWTCHTGHGPKISVTKFWVLQDEAVSWAILEFTNNTRRFHMCVTKWVSFLASENEKFGLPMFILASWNHNGFCLRQSCAVGLVISSLQGDWTDRHTKSQVPTLGQSGKSCNCNTCHSTGVNFALHCTLLLNSYLWTRCSMI